MGLSILEHYIKKVHKVEPYLEGMIKATLTVNCYRFTHKCEKVFLSVKEWETAKQQGYYME